MSPTYSRIFLCGARRASLTAVLLATTQSDTHIASTAAVSLPEAAPAPLREKKNYRTAMRRRVARPLFQPCHGAGAWSALTARCTVGSPAILGPAITENAGRPRRAAAHDRGAERDGKVSICLFFASEPPARRGTCIAARGTGGQFSCRPAPPAAPGDSGGTPVPDQQCAGALPWVAGRRAAVRDSAPDPRGDWRVSDRAEQAPGGPPGPLSCSSGRRRSIQVTLTHSRTARCYHFHSARQWARPQAAPDLADTMGA